jgi:beta-alanine--pyruvate transaminase
MDRSAALFNEPLDNHWMPFTANRQFQEAPRIIVRAEGIHYWNPQGDRIIDGISGLYTTPAGHGRVEIREAVTKQMADLDYAPAFQFGTPGSFRLASMLAAMTPGDLNRIFFTGGGSESVETALKIAINYHRARGEGQRLRLVGREKGYHGVNFGGWSVGGMVKNRQMFGLGLPGVSHIRHTMIPENRFQMGRASMAAKPWRTICSARSISMAPIRSRLASWSPLRGRLEFSCPPKAISIVCARSATSTAYC